MGERNHIGTRGDGPPLPVDIARLRVLVRESVSFRGTGGALGELMQSYFTRARRNDNGVSPVVGTILMVAVTVALGATVLAIMKGSTAHEKKLHEILSDSNERIQWGANRWGTEWFRPTAEVCSIINKINEGKILSLSKGAA